MGEEDMFSVPKKGEIYTVYSGADVKQTKFCMILSHF